jgi:imidazolonepropionase-like amidohydrolase
VKGILPDRQLGVVGGLVLSVVLAAAQSATGTIAFVGVTVVPMDRERMLADQTVVVADGMIRAIGPSASVVVPPAARRIDGSGKYLMPALAEMHAHLPGGDAPPEATDRVLTMYAMNGIGTLRSMVGHSSHIGLRARAASGDTLALTIVAAGPSFSGGSARTEESAVSMVKQQKSAGYDFLKIHPGIRRPVYDAIVGAARQADIRWAGHVPAEVGLLHALGSGQATIDHLDGYLEALTKGPLPPPSSQNLGGVDAVMPFGLNLVDQIDESRMSEVVAATKAAGASVVPTQILLENWVDDVPPESMAKRPEMRYAAPGDIQKWIGYKTQTLAATTPAQRKRFVELRRRLIKTLHDADVPILLGSDSPQIWNVPGFSIHRELRTYVASGLTPYQALETGTRNVASYFKTDRDTGTVATGKRADLILLHANPLADIENASRIAGIMLRGRWLPRLDLEQRVGLAP